MKRKGYEKKAWKEVRRMQRRLGLRDWKLSFHFADGASDSRIDNRAAACDSDSMHQSAIILFNRRLKPQRYRKAAAHELLHVRFWAIERAFAAMDEPAKTMLEHQLHQSIERISAALSDDHDSHWRDQEYLDHAPWESAT